MKRDWVIPILAICIIAFVIWLNVHENTKTVIEIEEKAIPAQIIDIQHFDNQQSVAVKYKIPDTEKKGSNLQTQDEVDFNNKYFITTEYETQMKTIGRSTYGQQQINYFNLYVYDISSAKEKLLKKIDVLNLMKQKYSEEIKHVAYRGGYSYKNRDYVSFRVFSFDEKASGYEISYDIQNDSWIKDASLHADMESWGSFPQEAGIILETNFSNRWINNGDLFIQNLNIILSSSQTNSSFDIPLFSRYPELNSFNHLDNGENMGLFFSVPPNDLLNLYIPKGKNPYDGLILDKNNSNDGQEHEIHSFEDYKKYSRWFRTNF